MQSRMEQPSEQSLWGMLEGITENLKHKRLADVFRFVSFRPFETFGPHKHLRIEINYVKKGNCILHLENESIRRLFHTALHLIDAYKVSKNTGNAQ